MEYTRVSVIIVNAWLGCLHLLTVDAAHTAMCSDQNKVSYSILICTFIVWQDTLQARCFKSSPLAWPIQFCTSKQFFFTQASLHSGLSTRPFHPGSSTYAFPTRPFHWSLPNRPFYQGPSAQALPPRLFHPGLSNQALSARPFHPGPFQTGPSNLALRARLVQSDLPTRSFQPGPHPVALNQTLRIRPF